MKTLGFDHLNLTVKNFDETVDWYKKVFNFEKVEEGVRFGERWGVLKSGESMLCIYEDDEARLPTDENGLGEGIHRIYHFGLRIDNRETWEGVLNEYQLETFYASPVRYPHSHSWYVKDPTGYTIEVALWDGNEAEF